MNEGWRGQLPWQRGAGPSLAQQVLIGITRECWGGGGGGGKTFTSPSSLCFSSSLSLSLAAPPPLL